MNENHVDRICMSYGQSFALLLFSGSILCFFCWIYASEGGVFVPTVGGSFSLITWALLHVRFRRELTKIIRETKPTEKMNLLAWRFLDGYHTREQEWSRDRNSRKWGMKLLWTRSRICAWF